MLFAAVSCVIGMVVAGGLLSPAGDQTQMRANAGISFICKSRTPSLSFIPIADSLFSPLYGLLLGWMDTPSGSLPGGSTLL